MKTSLAPMQHRLEQIYQLDLNQRIDDYLFSDKEVVEVLDQKAGARRAVEKLFVHQQGDNLNVSLYVDAKVLDSYQQIDEATPLAGEHLTPLCTVLEGVSHFLYLIWNAEQSRSVTQLELELQAEVDKYVSLAMLHDYHDGSQPGLKLRHWLFDDVKFDSSLNHSELNRYRDANRYAAKFCRWLEHRYKHAEQRREMISVLREFYRATKTEKLHMIDQNSIH